MKVGIASGFIRKHAVAEAVLVTRENMIDVRIWCGGTMNVNTSSGTPELYIAVPINKTSMYDNKPKRAYVGDYILQDGQGFKVYRQADFERMYDQITTDMIDSINEQMDKVS